MLAALKKAWEAGGRMCSRRSRPFLPELVEALERHGELNVTGEFREQLCLMSAATIDRLLKSHRHRGPIQLSSTIKPGSLLKAAIPICTFADWDDKRPGFLEVNLVAHCGDSTEGFHLNTLTAVDVATGWVECRGVGGKDQGPQSVWYCQDPLPKALGIRDANATTAGCPGSAVRKPQSSAPTQPDKPGLGATLGHGNYYIQP